jgi:hypothetical protein
VRIDFTLTLPGLFEIERIMQLAQEHNTEILSKLIFSFSPDIIMSPLALPRDLLDSTVDRIATTVPSGALYDVLQQLKTRSTFAEQWPEEWQAGLAKGKQRVLKLESIRGDSYTMADILKINPDIHDWYQAIVT